MRSQILFKSMSELYQFSQKKVPMADYILLRFWVNLMPKHPVAADGEFDKTNAVLIASPFTGKGLPPSRDYPKAIAL